jgi:hypothetical protein
MELLATKKINLSQQEKFTPITNKNNDDLNKKDCVVALRINALLYNTLQNYLSAMHNVSDYTFTSVSDILRHILSQIQHGESQNKGVMRFDDKRYVDVTIRVTEQQKIFWSSLPNRLKRTIMEKAIIEFAQKNK